MRLLTTIHLLAILALALGCARDVPQLLPLSQDAVILAFGDSLTHGTGASEGESYPAVLERLTGLEVINEGIPGELSGEGLARLEEALKSHRPDLLLLCHGGNDMLRRRSMAALQANLEKMVEIAQQQGVQVVLIGVPEPAIFGLESADVYYEVARKYHLALEDTIIPQVLSDQALKSDQVHPNARGYRLIAESLNRLLQEAGALP